MPARAAALSRLATPSASASSRRGCRRAGSRVCRKRRASRPPGDPVRIGLFEKGLQESEVGDFQKAACLTADGKFTAETRAAILAFLKRKGVKDSAFPDRITAKDGTKLRDILDAGPSCGPQPPGDAVRLGLFEKGLQESGVAGLQKAARLAAAWRPRPHRPLREGAAGERGRGFPEGGLPRGGWQIHRRDASGHSRFP